MKKHTFESPPTVANFQGTSLMNNNKKNRAQD